MIKIDYQSVKLKGTFDLFPVLLYSIMIINSLNFYKKITYD